jgi:hypothetical protein
MKVITALVAVVGLAVAKAHREHPPSSQRSIPMKLAAIALIGLAVAGSAAASTRVSDVEFLKANRCKGLAAGLGADTAGLDAFIKAEGRSRQDVVLRMGGDQLDRAKREAANANLKDKVSAELSGGCSAFMSAGKAVAGQ